MSMFTTTFLPAPAGYYVHHIIAHKRSCVTPVLAWIVESEPATALSPRFTSITPITIDGVVMGIHAIECPRGIVSMFDDTIFPTVEAFLREYPDAPDEELSA